MRKILVVFCAALLLAPSARAQTSQVQTSQVQYELAITPFLPVRTMMQNYQSMRAYLEAHLQEPVTLVTAPDYRTYNERMRQREYPFVITVANSAYLAHVEHGYAPMLRPSILTRPVLVVAAHSDLKSLKDMRGATLTLPDPLAIIAMQGVQMLREAGLHPERDLNLKHTANHAAAVNHVISGEAVAAIVSDRALLQMPKVTRQAVRVLQTWDAGAVPGVVYLAGPQVPRVRVERLQQAILQFVHDTEEGQMLMKNLGYGGLTPIGAEDLKPLAPYGAQLKAALEAAPDAARVVAP